MEMVERTEKETIMAQEAIIHCGYHDHMGLWIKKHFVFKSIIFNFIAITNSIMKIHCVFAGAHGMGGPDRRVEREESHFRIYFGLFLAVNPRGSFQNLLNFCRKP